MVRPKNCRLIQQEPPVIYFKPRGIPLQKLEEVTLTLDEMESLRLADMLGQYHEPAAQSMGLSRATFGRILESARKKVASALIEGKAIRIEGGNIQMASQRKFECLECTHQWTAPFGTGRPEQCPSCSGTNLRRCNDESASSEHAAIAQGRGCGHPARKGRQCRGNQKGKNK